MSQSGYVCMYVHRLFLYTYIMCCIRIMCTPTHMCIHVTGLFAQRYASYALKYALYVMNTIRPDTSALRVNIVSIVLRLVP